MTDLTKHMSVSVSSASRCWKLGKHQVLLLFSCDDHTLFPYREHACVHLLVERACISQALGARKSLLAGLISLEHEHQWEIAWTAYVVRLSPTPSWIARLACEQLRQLQHVRRMLQTTRSQNGEHRRSEKRKLHMEVPQGSPIWPTRAHGTDSAVWHSE